uniref:SFRICE_032711 n=1 Tax=Spodoptera frugiperda TaxID=7108 RepID=A0A2H1VC66_SPOFR
MFAETVHVAGDAPPPPLFMEDEDPEMSLMFEDSYRRLSQTENTGPDLAGIRQMLDLVRNLDRDDDDDSGCIGDQTVGDAPPPSLLMDDDDPEMSLMFGDSYRRQTENTGSDLTGIRQVLDLVRNLDRDDDDDDSGDIAEATGTVPKKDTAAQYMVMRDAPPPPLLMEEEDSEMSLMFGDSY